MNKIIVRTLTAVAASFIMLFCFAACGEVAPQAEPINIAFVIGKVDDETVFNTKIAEFSSLASLPQTDYAFISTEGEPKVITTGSIPDLTERGYTKTMMERVYAGISADVSGKLGAYTPSSGEIDMARATQLVVRHLKANSSEGKRNILVYYCSGRSTKGLINMVETPVYKLDIEASAAALAEMMDADMSGIDVVFYCCGDFGNKQPKLSPDERVKLKSFYNHLFTNLGANSVTFKDDLPSSECYSFPNTPVSLMEVKGESSGLTMLDPSLFENADASLLMKPLMIPETKVQYKPDSSEFLDPTAAAAAIQPIAEHLAKYGEVNVLLYGTCAGDADSDYTLRLGKERAEAVKQALVSAGVDAGRITVVSIKSTNDPYYKHGLGTGPEASANRKCVLMDITSDVARGILSAAIK